MLLTTLVTVALLAAPAIRALPRQTPSAKTAAASDETVLRFGKLWDGSKVTTDAVVVVERDRVKSVGSGNAAVPANAKVIDLSKYYAIPGMIDAHTHITYWADATWRLEGWISEFNSRSQPQPASLQARKRASTLNSTEARASRTPRR